MEFIVDGADGLRTDGFWFMEMNTRLQVEHPVTEAITGVDLVEWQLRVASGEGLPKMQDQLTINGHAFEARLYAEDVPKGFLPATGRLDHLVFPDIARADTGVRAGDEISPFYDPMIAKLITHGPTRAVALQRLSAALAGTEVAGTVTNLAFLGALAGHAGFAQGEVDTGLIGRDLETLVVQPVPTMGHIALAAFAALGLAEARHAQIGFTLWSPLERVITLRFEDEDIHVRLQALSPNAHDLLVGDQVVELRHIGGCWQVDGQPAPQVALTGGKVTVFAGYGLSFDIIDPLEQAEVTGAAAGVIEAPMPGLVKSVTAKPGQKVAKGDRLAVLEAMKMEHTLTAARDGVVAEVLVAAGDQVTAGAALVRLEEEEDAAA